MPSSVTPKKIDSIRLYRKEYTQFRGVDFSTDPTQVADYRSPYAVNLVSDLAGFPEKRPGWETVKKVDARINGIHDAVFKSGAVMRFIHSGTKLLTWEGEEICTSMADSRSVSFAHGGRLFVLDGLKYRMIEESNGEYTVINVEDRGFVPTTSIGMTPSGGGTLLEEVNLLSPKRINSFIADGISTTYLLDTPELDSIDSVKVNGELYTLTDSWKRTKPNAIAFIPSAVPSAEMVLIKVNDTSYLAAGEDGTPLVGLVASERVSFVLTTERDESDTYYLAKQVEEEAAPVLESTLEEYTYTLTDPKTYVVDLVLGTVDFAVPPKDSDGIDGVIIQISKAIEGYADRVNKCTICTFYGYNNDNRIFISGNPDFKNWDWQSGLEDPTYFPDRGYTQIGSDTSAIMGYLKQYNSLTIIKADNNQDAEVYLRTAEIMDDGSIIFPVKQGIKGVGAVSKHAIANLMDDPLFLAKEGVFAIASTAVQQERTVQNRSYFVNTVLTTEPNLSEAVAAVWNGYYVLAVNGKAYVADSRKMTAQTDSGNISYEWYYWTNIPARVMCEYDGVLYFGTEDGRVCAFKSDIATVRKYSDDGEPILARWSTKMDDYGSIVRRKTLTKKGCGVMIKPYVRSSVTVYAATDRMHEARIRYSTMDILDFSDIDFSRFTFNTLDTPQVVPLNKKIKKFIVLQLIFENKEVDEGFGIYGVQTQYAVGGYVK